MAVPSSVEVQLFYRCAFRRYEVVQILLRAERTTSAVYLAGYSIERILIRRSSSRRFLRRTGLKCSSHLEGIGHAISIG